MKVLARGEIGNDRQQPQTDGGASQPLPAGAKVKVDERHAGGHGQSSSEVLPLGDAAVTFRRGGPHTGHFPGCQPYHTQQGGEETQVRPRAPVPPPDQQMDPRQQQAGADRR